MTALDLDGPLWRFAVRLYGREGVSAACLRLQDEGGVDVLLLLAGLYAQIAMAAPLREEDLRSLALSVEDWRNEAIAPLRALRIWLKPARPALPDSVKDDMRNQVKALELQAERIQLAVIAQWLERNAELYADGGPLQLAWLVADRRPGADLVKAFGHVSAQARAA